MQSARESEVFFELSPSTTDPLKVLIKLHLPSGAVLPLMLLPEDWVALEEMQRQYEMVHGLRSFLSKWDPYDLALVTSDDFVESLGQIARGEVGSVLYEGDLDEDTTARGDG